MSTFLKIKPTEHPTIKMTGIRLDDDNKATYRTETGGVATDTRVNFSGLLTDQTFQGTAPIGLVTADKLGTQERVVIEVLAYYAKGEEDTVPSADIYWYDTRTHYRFGGPVEAGKSEAADPHFNTPQVFPVTIYNESKLAAWSTGNTVVSSITNTRIFGQLGSVEARRQYLKSKLAAILDDPTRQYIMDGTSLPPIPQDSVVNIEDATGTLVTAQNILDRRKQGFLFRLEMLARAVSIDSNLSDEAKFNLIEGEIDLPIADVFSKMPQQIAGDIAGTRPRANWHFRKISSVGAAPTYKYTVPSTMDLWSTTYDANIDLGSAAPPEVLNWSVWIKS